MSQKPTQTGVIQSNAAKRCNWKYFYLTSIVKKKHWITHPLIYKNVKAKPSTGNPKAVQYTSSVLRKSSVSGPSHMLTSSQSSQRIQALAFPLKLFFMGFNVSYDQYHFECFHQQGRGENTTHHRTQLEFWLLCNTSVCRCGPWKSQGEKFRGQVESRAFNDFEWYSLHRDNEI